MPRPNVVPIYGLDYKDKPDDAAARGSRRTAIPTPRRSSTATARVGIDYGVYGVPETFVIDKQGVIRYKQIGPMTVEALQQKILPLVRELQQ